MLTLYFGFVIILCGEKPGKDGEGKDGSASRGV